VLSYAIVCPWEAVATGNLLARVFPSLNTYQMYVVDGSPIQRAAARRGAGADRAHREHQLPRHQASGVFQDVMTFGLLATFAIFTLLGFAKGSVSNMQPPSRRRAARGCDLPRAHDRPYFMRVRVGREGIGGSEAASITEFHEGHLRGARRGIPVLRRDHRRRHLRLSVAGDRHRHVRTEVAFERTFGSHAIAQLILFGAFLSLLKIFNGNFVARPACSTPSHGGTWCTALGRVHAVSGTPVVAITLMAGHRRRRDVGDAILVPISEVARLAVGVGWMSRVSPIWPTPA